MRFDVVLLGFALLPGAVGSATAKTVGADDLGPAEEARIEHASKPADVRCYRYAVKALEERFAKADISVKYAEPALKGIELDIRGQANNYTCEGGELRAWEAGDYTVVKQF